VAAGSIVIALLIVVIGRKHLARVDGPVESDVDEAIAITAADAS
jgi:ACDE family multidrug resistance protein